MFAPEALAALLAVVLLLVGVLATVVAAKTVNVLGPGPSAAGPGAYPEVEQSSGATPPVSGDCWAAGRGRVFPSHVSPGGPPTQT